ncbi:hypothetical protein, partial [Myxosarcina sp. GI1]|uniref:hypothetical protein n=1 Tax=Myxosarcina sp. GI1 TaxID=1541065 RepID=UPI00055E5FAE
SSNETSISELEGIEAIDESSSETEDLMSGWDDSETGDDSSITELEAIGLEDDSLETKEDDLNIEETLNEIDSLEQAEETLDSLISEESLEELKDSYDSSKNNGSSASENEQSIESIFFKNN